MLLRRNRADLGRALPSAANHRGARLPFAFLALLLFASSPLLRSSLLAQEETSPSSPSSPTSVPGTGKLDPRLESFDRLLRDFVVRHDIPGAALAVTDQGRLVFARGYGWADAEKKELVQPDSLFRIASISKPITALAVLLLAKEGKLRLDDRLVDVLPVSKRAEGGSPPDPRFGEITLRQLLQHRGGWDRDVSFDPMFRAVEFANELGVEPPASARDVIRCMLHRPLDFSPGDRYAYSNFGYCLLGRVIEKVTGDGYEAWVRGHVLEPLGIRSMRLGHTRIDSRAPGEVCYFHPGHGESCFARDLGREVAYPYGAFNLEAMDAHGGWIASAIDIVRFARALDEKNPQPLIDAEGREQAFARPPGAAGHERDGSPKDVWYGLGWLVRDVGGGHRNTWHTGSLPGTATLLVRRFDGRSWAVLFNTRVSKVNERISLTGAIDPLLHKAANAVTEWPKYDLFADGEEEISGSESEGEISGASGTTAPSSPTSQGGCL